MLQQILQCGPLQKLRLPLTCVEAVEQLGEAGVEASS